MAENKTTTIKQLTMTRDKTFNFIFLYLFFILAILIRYSLLDFETGDYTTFISPWIDFISKNGLLNSFQYKFSDYNPPYLHLLAFSTLLPLKKIYAAKLISVIFDSVLAYIVSLIINKKYQSKTIAMIAFFAILFLPTVVLNGSFWGQCDVIFTTFSVLCLYFLMNKKNNPALISFGMALSFKFQAIFLLPFLFALYLKKYIQLKYFFWIPAMLTISIVPSLIAGRPLLDLLEIYINQAGTYKMLSLNAPNIYHWFSNNYFSFLNLSGIIFAAFIGLAYCFFIYKSPKKINDSLIIKLALVSTLMLPFFLPQMHERYFFLADIISVLYAFYDPRKFYISLVIVMVSFFSYFPFLFNQVIFDLSYLAVIMGIILVLIIHDTFVELYKK